MKQHTSSIRVRKKENNKQKVTQTHPSPGILLKKVKKKKKLMRFLAEVYSEKMQRFVQET